MNFAIETWDPAYGSSVQEPGLEPTSQSVDVSVELVASDWRAVEPAATTGPGSITFVDGVRRIDARVWIAEPDGRSRPGVCASVAAGAVRCTPGRAELTDVIVERGLFTASEHAEPITSLGDLGHGYDLRPVADDSDESMYLGVHRHMIELEAALADELGDPGVVVYDGPLGRRDNVNAVGYIKTHHVSYLSVEHQLVVAGLGIGERSPLFRVESQWPTWSWYLRLPGPIIHGMSGVVRLELPGLGDAATAADRADLVSTALPGFASEAHKESRAPQNLYPIAGLERQLRRRLGDARLLERALRGSAA
jgi:hypothetical protein